MKLKLFLGFVQCASFFPTTFSSIPWPEGYLNIARWLEIFSADFFSAFGFAECTFATGFYQQFMFSFWLLPAALVCTVLPYGILRLVRIAELRGPLLSTAVCFADAFALGVYAAAFATKTTHRMSGTHIYDFFMGAGMDNRSGVVNPVSVYRIDPTDPHALTNLTQNMCSGELAALAGPGREIVLGAPLASHLGLLRGDSVALIVSEPGPGGLTPRIQPYRLVGTFEIGADLATEGGEASIPTVDAAIVQLESWIDESEAQLPALTSFVLPGGCRIAALLHLARTVSRRAERCYWTLERQVAADHPVPQQIGVYLNRLSDLCFSWARLANQHAGVADIPWRREP